MASDDIKQQAVKELARRELSRRQSGEISGDDISNHPINSTVKTFMQPASQSLFGKTAEQGANAIAQNPRMGQSNTAPYDKNLGMVKPSAMALNIAGQGVDAAQTPSTYAIAPILKGLGILGKAAIKPFQEAARISGELSTISKEVGAASKSPDSIVRKMSDLKDSSIAPLKESVESEESNFQDVKESLQKEIENKKGLKSGKLELTKDYQKTMKENIMADLNKQKEFLEEALQGESEGIAKYMKDEIPEKVKSMNEVFGKHIDDISDAMEKAGKGISHTDRFNILNATKQEVDDIGINNGRAKKLLDSLHADASNTVEPKKVPLGIVDVTGKPIVSEVAGQGSDIIPFRNFIQETRSFRKILNDSKLSGVKGMNDEDIVGAIYNKNVNKYLQENVSGYRSLQKDYGPVINAMKTARRIFKPGDIYSDEQGVNLLKRYATGKTSAGKEQLLKDMQSSSRFGEGTKDVTSGLKSIGDKIDSVEGKLSSMPKQLYSKFSKELDDIRDSHDKDISNLQERLYSSKNESQAKIDSLKDQISEVSSRYDARIRTVRDTADKLRELHRKGKIAGLLGVVGLGEVAKPVEHLKHLIAK